MSLEFIQLNFKKSLLASVEFNKKITGLEKFICLATEPYIAFDKLGNMGRGVKSFSIGKAPRAAILYDMSQNVSGLEKYSNRDCAAAVTKISGTLT